MARKWMTTLVLSLALILAACAPGDGLGTPTPPIEIQPGATEPLLQPTIPTGTEAPPGPALEPTAVIPNTGGTESAMTKTTPAAKTTPQASPAATQAMDEEPAYIRTSDFVGYEIVTEMGQVVGVVDDILADEAGVVHYVLADVGSYVGLDTRPSAIPWSQFKIVKDKQQFVFTGTTGDLTATVEYDPTLLDQADGVVLETDGTQLPEEFDQLIRISQYGEFDLRNMNDESLGAVDEIVVDLAQGEVRYALVDVGSFLGTAAATVAVPWERLALKQDATAQIDHFILDVSEETLRQAPTVDLNALPTWPELIDPNWDAGIRQFWENAG